MLLSVSMLVASAALVPASCDESPMGMQATKFIEACEKSGVCVKHSVDATALQKTFAEGSFQCCIFNFPHTGEQRVHANQAMLRAFFKSARFLLPSHAPL